MLPGLMRTHAPPWWLLVLLTWGAVGPAAAGEAVSPGEATGTPPPLRLRVAGAQLPVGRDVGQNLLTILRAIEYAARERAQVLVTPEGSLSGYTPQFDAAATAQALDQVRHRARAAGIALVLGTCFADDTGARYDAQRFYDQEGNDLGFHAKVLLCRRMADPGTRGEADFFRSAPLRTFRLNGVVVGGLICNDLWANPEWTPGADPFLARQLASRGARIIFLSANTGLAEGDELELNRGFHEANLRLRARGAGVWIVVADAADPDGRRASNCASGVVGPDGRWKLRVEAPGEQFFAYTIALSPNDPVASAPPPPAH
jgi:predicted amidohydrolase